MNFKQIATYDNYLLANMTMGLLTENDIKCQMKDEHIVTVDPLLNPAVGGIKLLVEENDFERAVALMKEAENNYLKDIACPVCKVHAMSMVEKTNDPQDFWGRLKNQLLYGQPSTYSKSFCCTSCGKTFAELPPSF